MCVESFSQCRARTNCLSKQINLSHSHLAKTLLFTLWQIEDPRELKALLPSRSHVCTQRRISTVTEAWGAKTHSPTHGEPAIKQFTGSSYETVGKQEFTSAEGNFSDHLYSQSSKQLCCASKNEQEFLSDECLFSHCLLSEQELYVRQFKKIHWVQPRILPNHNFFSPRQ